MSRWFIVLILAILQTTSLAWSKGNDEKVRLIIHVLDYLKKDYHGAVDNGKVINAYEYSEQVDFANTVFETARDLDLPKLNEKAKQLQKAILIKREDVVVRDFVDQVREELDKNFKLIQVPTTWPSLEEGRKLFSSNCTQCHGTSGAGDGPSAAGITPPPTNFLNSEAMESSTPTRVFNTLKLGIKNTPMRAFGELSDEQLWALSFFVTSLRHPQPSSIERADLSLLEEAAQKTDTELLQKYFKDSQNPISQLAAVRHISFDKNASGFVQTARFYVARAQATYNSGDLGGAGREAVKAYLEGVEPLEPRLRASDKDIVSKIEADMAALRESFKKENNQKEIGTSVSVVEQTLREIEKTLTTSHLSPTVVYGTSAAIFLREGFEAVLIILALLSVLRAIGSRRAMFWVHAGWLSAMGLGVVFWFFSGALIRMSGAQRETMEALISLFAVVVLLYMGFWLHSRTEVDRWKKFLGSEMKRFVEDQKFFGLFVLSFIGVFRESFETVLFLRAIAIETNPSEQYIMWMGVLTALSLILLLAWMLMRFSQRVPIRSLFLFCAVTVVVLAVILMGKGVHSLQEIGWLGVTSTPFNWRAEIIGIFPSWECWLAQGLTIIVAVALWSLGSRKATA